MDQAAGAQEVGGKRLEDAPPPHPALCSKILRVSSPKGQPQCSLPGPWLAL